MADYENFNDRPLRYRTYESIKRELAPFHFSEDLIQSLWHRLNGREEIAQSYLEAFLQEQESMRTQLSTEPRNPFDLEWSEEQAEAKEPFIETLGYEESKEESI